MTTATQQIAAERQRSHIPGQFLKEFEYVTNAELAGLAEGGGQGDRGTYAGWELEYREAFGIVVEWQFQDAPYTQRHARTVIRPEGCYCCEAECVVDRGMVPVVSGPNVNRIVRRKV